MNPTKSILGVASGKFLEFIVTSKEIHLNPEKIHAVQEMQPLRNLKELRGLQGHPEIYIESSRTMPTLY